MKDNHRHFYSTKHSPSLSILMETLQIQPENLLSRTHFMYSISAKLRPKFFQTCSQQLRALSTPPSLNLSLSTSKQELIIHEPTTTTKKTVSRNSVRVKVKTSDAQLKENWLASLSCPFPKKAESFGIDGGDTIPQSNVGPEWVIGIDPDLSGALAVLKTDDSGCTAQVFDSPRLQVLVGRRVRRRLDANSIVKLLQSFEAPIGTIAYLEQSTPYPQDGKQGWWSGGFGYGLWIGVLVASGFSVVPVPSCTWKNEFELSGNQSNKDDSRRVASTLFPSMSSLLKRKKDHGRAEALLIAAYGKGLKMKSKSLCISQELVP